MKRIGIDIDGVLANFIPSYQRLHILETGRDDFHIGDDVDPPDWNWPATRGYTSEETSRVWDRIKKDDAFWFNLAPMVANVTALRTFLWEQGDHDIYFITSRLGVDVKSQTEAWLHTYFGGRAYGNTTLIVGHRVKGLIAKALQLDIYIDDNLDNVYDCLNEAPKTHTYLLNRAYNQGGEGIVCRVDSIQQMFKYEGLWIEQEDPAEVEDTLP